MTRRIPSPFHGVLVVDKAHGPTSHDVVRKVRRALGTRVVGHTGTLDPMATGVLVVAVGEATKLVPYLTAQDKTYKTTLALGSETTTLDAQGELTETAPSVQLSRDRWQVLANEFLGEHTQQVPRVSAVRVDGQRLHDRARRGEDFEPPSRQVVAHAIEVLDVDGAVSVQLRLHCGKGFYVRSFARDLARRAGTLGHLTALRRESNGCFVLKDAVPFAEVERIADEAPELRGTLAERLVPLAETCRRTMAVLQLGSEAQADAFHGRPVPLEAALGTPPEEGGVACLLDEQGAPLAVARRSGETLQVVRGFRGVTDAHPLR